MSFLQVHTPRWLSHFARGGYAEAAPLAAGVQGAVYRLGDGVVAKVWGRRRRPELLLAQRFYADVAAAGLPFATPVILRVEEIDQTAITYERELHGTPLKHRIGDSHPELDAATVSCLLQVVKALATVSATPAMRQSFSTAGDPRMDAGIMAILADMYGPHGAARAHALTHTFAAELGYPIDVLLVYQAAYAIATSNAFTDDGSDRHFAWCVAQLNRPDLNAAIDK
jgi:hypothetical protein